MLEVQKRGCTPLENFIFTARLKMWPIWQKGMADHIDGVKRLAEGIAVVLSCGKTLMVFTGSSSTTLGAMFRKTATTDAAVKSVSLNKEAIRSAF